MNHQEDEIQDDNSQVRSIIRQLNEDIPGKEKERTVVVRSDGSKVVRVTKKRRTMVSREEKSRKSRKVFMQGFLVLFLLMAAVASFFFYRLTTMSGEAFLMNRGQELEKIWGASSVKCTGAVIDGVHFHISNIVADFPESSMLQRVELSEPSSELDLGSFFTGMLTGGDLKIGRAHIYLRQSARRLHLPQATGENIWRFLRVSCPDFSISFAGEDSSPWSIRHTGAYMYRPSAGSPLTVVTFEGGSMQMRGWKAVNIQSAKLHFSQLAIEDFTLSGTTDGSSASMTESSRTSISFSGAVADGGNLAGPFYFTSDNMNFSDFTEGRFNHFFSARTLRPSLRSGAPETQVRLPLESSFPQFSGTFNLKDVSVSGFPALHVIIEHLEPTKRKRYMPPNILLATANLSHEGGAMTLSFDESGMSERDVITLRGRLTVDESRELSGTLDYGVPSVLTYAEYRDGKADPIFREDGHLAWVYTKVSGAAAHPQDDSHTLDASAVAERANRERLPFEEIDLERVNEFFKLRQEMLQPASTLPENNPQQGEGTSGEDLRLTPSGVISPGDALAPSDQQSFGSPF